MTRDHAVEYLTLAFQTQRPTIHHRSASFPNFDKFFNLTLSLELQISKNEGWVQERVATRLGEDANTLSCPGIDQVIQRRTAIPNHLPPLPMTAFITSSNTPPQTSSLHSRKTRKKYDMNSTGIDSVAFVKGRYIKTNHAGQGQPPQVAVGMLLSKVDIGPKETWKVMITSDHILELPASTFEIAFPPGQRVVVDWHGSGELYLGCVVAWEGGSKYQVWFDVDRRVAPVFGTNMSLSTAPLPKTFPKRFHSQRNTFWSHVFFPTMYAASFYRNLN
jgi:hypothetical protein